MHVDAECNSVSTQAIGLTSMDSIMCRRKDKTIVTM
jgi:hypothetical protein